MRYLVLASDYDGTLADQGLVAPKIIEKLNLLKSTGRKLVLVTGRVSGAAGLMNLPYLAWVSVAACLNLRIVRLNAPFGEAA